MSIDTDGLRLFILAAELLNISAAGRRLGMAPAVSSAKLSKLEVSLGAELLHRTTRKVALSVEGAEFLPFAREIIAQEDAGMAALGKGTARVSGTLRFAAPSTFAQLYIAPILPKFLNMYPDLTLDLRLSDVQFDLIEGSYDLVLRSAPLVDTSLKGRKLADDRRILCAAPEYLDQHGRPEKPEDLRQHRLVGFQHLGARPFRNALGETVRFDPSTSESQLIFDDGMSQKHATIAGVGISINAVWSVYDALKSGALERVLPDYESAEDNVLWLL